MNEQELIEQLIIEEDVYNLCRILFDVELTEKQQEIVGTIAFRKHDRVSISAFTRWGKTFSVAVATALYLYLHEDKLINEIAPVRKQSKRFREYLINFIIECDELLEELDVHVSGIERIKKEVSKTRMTFKDGSEVNIRTAGGQNLAQSLMGAGGDLILVDETCDIDEEIFRKRITRMLGESKDSVLVEIGNPWHKSNHFYKHWQGDKYKTFRISYHQGLEEGRISREFVEEQRDELTPLEFQVLYEAEFPDSVEGGLIRESWILDAINRELEPKNDITKIYGLDVASQGKDLTVLTEIQKWEEDVTYYKVVDIQSWHEADTMTTAKRVDSYIKQGLKLKVDSIGIGKGVADKLSKTQNVEKVNVGKRARDKDRFSNLKAELFWNLREIFEEGRIDIPDNQQLKNQLVGMKYDFTSSGKIKIKDPSKSPDFADSLMLALAQRQHEELSIDTMSQFHQQI